jgi:hypothetical protein
MSYLQRVGNACRAVQCTLPISQNVHRPLHAGPAERKNFAGLLRNCWDEHRCITTNTDAGKSGGHEEHRFLSASNPPVEVGPEVDHAYRKFS